MEQETPSDRHLADLQAQLKVLDRKAEFTPVESRAGWGYICLHREIQRITGEIAQLVFLTFAAMSAEELWEYLDKHYNASMAALSKLGMARDVARLTRPDGTRDEEFDAEPLTKAAIQEITKLNNGIKYVRQLRAAFDEKRPGRPGPHPMAAIELKQDFTSILTNCGTTVFRAFIDNVPPYKLSSSALFCPLCDIIANTLEYLEDGDIGFIDRDTIGLWEFEFFRWNFLELDVKILKDEFKPTAAST